MLIILASIHNLLSDNEYILFFEFNGNLLSRVMKMQIVFIIMSSSYAFLIFILFRIFIGSRQRYMASKRSNGCYGSILMSTRNNCTTYEYKLKILKCQGSNITLAVGIVRDDNIDELLTNPLSFNHDTKKYLTFKKLICDNDAGFHPNILKEAFRKGDIVRVKFVALTYWRYLDVIPNDNINWYVTKTVADGKYRLFVYVKFDGPGDVQIQLL